MTDTIRYSRVCDICCYSFRAAGQLMSLQTASPKLAKPDEACESCGSRLVDWEINQATVIL